MSDAKMTVSKTIQDVVLVVLKDIGPLEPLGLKEKQFFAKVHGYDEMGLWIELPDFPVPVTASTDSGLWTPEVMENVNASAMIPWGALATVVHFPDVRGYDYPSPFNRQIGFKSNTKEE